METTINLAVQILPMSVSKQDAYAAVDSAIDIVHQSGLKYEVGPFETVIEGAYDTVMAVVKKMQETVFDRNVEHLIVNIKIQRTKGVDVRIEDKTGKYK